MFFAFFFFLDSRQMFRLSILNRIVFLQRAAACSGKVSVKVTRLRTHKKAYSIYYTKLRWFPPPTHPHPFIPISAKLSQS